MSDRIWARAQWLFPRLDAAGWRFVGSIAGEDRCRAGAVLARAALDITTENWLSIVPPSTHPALAEFEEKIDISRNQLLPDGPGGGAMTRLDLLCPGSSILEFAATLVEDSLPILLDISSMPKRFFFPILKYLMRSGVRDIIVLYAHPERYASESLAEDLEPLGSLPTYAGDLPELDAPKSELVVSVGFESAGISQVIEEVGAPSVTYLFPYPSIPPFGTRTWAFLQQGLQASGATGRVVRPVSSADPSSTFSVLSQIGDGGRNPLVLAPYGPKPTALGMALYACSEKGRASRVVYTQPKHYHPGYSRGVAIDRHGEVVHAYPVKLGGVSLYI